MATDSLKRGDNNNIQATRELFEGNVEKARAALKTLTEQKLQDNWTMKLGEKTILGPMPRGVVSRGFLFNHIYHHRGADYPPPAYWLFRCGTPPISGNNKSILKEKFSVGFWLPLFRIVKKLNRVRQGENNS